jgi:hypothetical protein
MCGARSYIAPEACAGDGKTERGKEVKSAKREDRGKLKKGKK